MYGMFLKLVAKQGKRDQLLEFLRWDAAVARAAEPCTIRFDVWDVPNQPDAVYLYEAYTNPEAFARHKANEPYKRFIDVIEPQLLDEKHTLFDFTESLISNADPIWQIHSDHTSGPSKVTQSLNSEISKLSFGSFAPDADALAHFNDYAELRRLAPDRNASVTHVHFPPGVRTDWHRHKGQQLLWFIEGEGKVALRDGRSLSCRAGDIVRVNAGSSHWHGASAEHHATHIAITVGETVWEDRPH
jgi:quercetin dioxygenase-like cupin family protein/quinol monooxygenase YgiN